MDRREVYGYIDNERDYQDNKWGGKENDEQHSIADWLIFMEIFLDKAKRALRYSSADALVNVVKIGALSVACLEHCVEDDEDLENEG